VKMPDITFVDTSGQPIRRAESYTGTGTGFGGQLQRWNPRAKTADAALLQATDELTGDAFITDATWARLGFLSEKQKMDLVMTVGQYTQVSMMLNSFGVQLDEGLSLDPDLTA